MAKVSVQYRETIESVTLTLSEAEAHFIMDILACVGGCPDTSRRMHADSLMRSLREARVYGIGSDDIRTHSSISFS